MANKFLTNLTPANFTACMYFLMQGMYNAGWSIMAWSDGTTAHNTGTIPGPYAAGPGSPDPVFPLTGAFPNGAAAGAGGLSNNRAWFVMRQPKTPVSASFAPVYGGTRMFVFQRNASANDTDWRIKYSVQGGYQFARQTNVTPSLYATLPNQDDVTIFGGGTDAAPTFTTLFGDTTSGNGISRFNVMCNDGASSETAPFGIYAIAFRNGGGVEPGMAFILEPMAAGTIGVGELDPYIIYPDGNGVNNVGTGNCTGNDQRGMCCTNSTFGPGGWLRYGQSNQAYLRIPACWYAQFTINLQTNCVVPASNGTTQTRQPVGTNPYNNNDDLFPIVFARSANQGTVTGYKGVSSMMKWNGTLRSIGDTQAQNTVRDRIIMGDLSLPWDGSVPAI